VNDLDEAHRQLAEAAAELRRWPREQLEQTQALHDEVGRSLVEVTVAVERMSGQLASLAARLDGLEARPQPAGA
jgi:hypothetical protein